MNIPSEFNGYVSFFWNTKHNFLACSHHDKMDDLPFSTLKDWLQISDPIALNVELFDVREKQIAALEKQIEQERAESQFRINQLLGKIHELQAIEVQK